MRQVYCSPLYRSRHTHANPILVFRICESRDNPADSLFFRQLCLTFSMFRPSLEDVSGAERAANKVLNQVGADDTLSRSLKHQEETSHAAPFRL